MYIERWDEFTSLAKDLFVANPGKVRYTFKYRHVDGALVLKVTDDKVCLKYKTDKLADVNKMDRFNNWFFSQATNSNPTVESPLEEEPKPTPKGKGKGRRKGK
mmetsp:Transcript_13085/g.15878  ORF Transcript_13085/g.15878 Transcript_13085/m.15878 type:complete len:103 (+) Transcript_13085:111-419(+)